MKIYFDNCEFQNRTGPNTFATRLAKALANRGHQIADANDYDIALVFIEKTNNLNLNKPYVHRLDGIWFKPKEYNTRNINIKSTYENATAVVFQSLFNMRQITGWWGHPQYCHIIHNGIDLEEIKIAQKSSLVDFSDLRKKHEQIFICSSNWHPQKRLISNIELFSYLRNHNHPDSCLIILGNNPSLKDIVNFGHNISNNIYIGGNVSHDVCLKMYSEADWMFHLAYLDHCPNVVVEAVSCGLPVVCSNEGGTCEIVGDCGLILNETNEYKYSLFDYDNPPPIKIDNIVLPQIDNKIKSESITRLNIQLVAEHYEKVLLSCL